MEIIKKLNDHNNFHLTFKCFCATNKEIILAIDSILTENKKKHVVIDSSKDVFIQLYDAYNNKIKYIIIDEKVTFMVPALTVLDTDNINVIKPLIPLLYMCKDNRVENKILHQCRLMQTPYKKIKTIEEIKQEVNNIIG